MCLYPHHKKMENCGLLNKDLFHFINDYGIKVHAKCLYKTVKITDKFDNKIFYLNGKQVEPIIYTGVWIDMESECDHSGDGDFWYTYDADIYIIAEVDGKYYIPRYDDGWWVNVTDRKFIDYAQDLASDVVPDCSHFDEFKEFSFSWVIELVPLYKKTKLPSKMFNFLNAVSKKLNLTCIYSTVKRKPTYVAQGMNHRYFMLKGEEVEPTVYSAKFVDKESKKNISTTKEEYFTYDAKELLIAEVNGKFYLAVNRKWSNEDVDSWTEHLVNKAKLLPTRVDSFNLKCQIFKYIVELVELNDFKLVVEDE